MFEPKTVWQEGKDKSYEAHRISPRMEGLRKWVDEAYYGNNLAQFLDKEFLDHLRNEDFFGRLWELELAEFLMLSGLKMVPANGSGPDFRIDMGSGSTVWIEATLSRPDEELEQNWRDLFSSEGKEYNTPRQEIALRYSSSLVGKANKIKDKYLSTLGKNDYMLIAVSGFPPGALSPDIDLFMRAILPIEDQLVYFTTDGSPLDEKAIRPTHTISREYIKKNGTAVKKEFLYPGDYFPFIDGVIFSEASNLQQLLGTTSSGFNDSTNCPHIFPSYAGKRLPHELTDKFFYHQFVENGEMVSLELFHPKQ